MRLYRILAVVVMLFTIYFSNTPNLMVIEPDTWTNSTEYEQIGPRAIFSSNSQFLEPWSEERGINFFLHKCSHVTFYALMAFFLLIYSKNVKSVLLKLVFLFLFALSDEIHQYYVVGRSGRLIDTLLDFSSVCVVLLMLIVSRKILFKQKNA